MRELDGLLSLSSWCLVVVMWLFLMVPWVGLQCVIMVCQYWLLLEPSAYIYIRS